MFPLNFPGNFTEQQRVFIMACSEILKPGFPSTTFPTNICHVQAQKRHRHGLLSCTGLHEPSLMQILCLPCRPPLPSNAAKSPEQPQHNSSSQQQAHAIVPGSKTISTAGQSAQHPAVDMQSEAAVHIHAGGPAMDAPQPGHDQDPQAGGSTSNAAVTQNDTPEQGISPIGYLQV